MADKAVSEIAVIVGADVSALKIGLQRGGKHVKAFGRDTDAMRSKMLKLGKAGGIAAAAILGATTAFAAAAKSASNTAVQIQNLSRLAGTSTREFQRWSAAAETVGVGQEKLADVLKDVNDKFGDFLTTGAGPLKDFFDAIAPKVGVTAEQFARLSGPDALQLYVSSLEKANVSQAQMTFFMEALASDATGLVPLLKNNAAALKLLGDEAERSGRILSDDMVQSGADLNEKFTKLGQTMRTEFLSAILENSKAFSDMVTIINDDLIPAIANMAASVAEAISDLKDLTKSRQIQLSVNGKPINGRGGDPRDYGFDAGEALIEKRKYEADQKRKERLKIGLDRVYESSGRGDDPRNYGYNADDAAKSRYDFLNPKSDKRKRSGGGVTRDDFEALKESLATEAELIQINYEKQLEQLDEFRRKKLGKEEEFNETEKRIHKEHQDALLELEKKRKGAMLQGMQGLFGDLASLMSSENKKLFEIGKAAATAEAIVTGYKAAVSAWEKGMSQPGGGPLLAAAYATASLAKTGSLISGIQGASATGGGGQPSVGGGSVPSSPAQSQKTYYNVNLSGDMVPTQSVRDFIQMLNEAVEDGAIIGGVRA